MYLREPCPLTRVDTNATQPQMNLNLLALSLASFFSLSFSMDAPSPLAVMSGKELALMIKFVDYGRAFGSIGGGPISEHFDNLNQDDLFGEHFDEAELVEKLADSLAECSNLLWSASTSGAVKPELLAKIAAKSNDEDSLIEALEHCINSGKLEKACVIWCHYPELIGKITSQELVPKFLQKVYEKEMKYILLKGRKQPESVVYGTPLEIFQQHIFPYME